MVRLFPVSICISMILLLNITHLHGQKGGGFLSVTEIGNPKIKGSTYFDESNQTYRMRGIQLSAFRGSTGRKYFV